MTINDSPTVLITTSGIGSRLGGFTKHSNKCLVRAGDKGAISYIIEGYPQGTSFVLTLGYHADLVKQYITLAHPTANIEYVEVDNYEGPGSSLGYSMLCAKERLQRPFIFHACDTLTEDNLYYLDHNWCAGYKKTNSSHYSTLNVERDRVKRINPKGEVNYDYEYIGICGIKDYELFWLLLEEQYKLNVNNSSLNDCDAMRLMLNHVEFNAYEYKVWNDIGNIESLKKTKQYYGSTFDILDKENEAIYFLGDKVIKYFRDTNINLKRVERMNYLNGLTPDLQGATSNFYCYSFIEGTLASKIITEDTIENLLNWAKDSLWINCHSDPENRVKCKQFYFDKTRRRINMLFKQLNKEDRQEKINGVTVPLIDVILESVDEKLLLNDKFCNYHGDFILDNILKTDDSFKLIDWRQDFGGDLRYGDIYYDLAKMNHNIFFNHENISNGLYELNEEDGEIGVDLKTNYRLMLVKKKYDDWCRNNGYCLKRIEVLTSLIWLNMAPLHEYPLNKFLFYFGKYNLHRSVREQ